MASVRYDSNSAFGGATTYRIAPAYLIPETGTKLKASYGTGFKAPSLDELYVNYPDFGFHSNPSLKPEESRGYDAGFEQALFGKRAEFGATYFHSDVTNLITFGPTSAWPGYTTYYLNLPSAKIDGAETYVTFKPRDDLKLRADYTYTMALNANFTAMDGQWSNELLRRPKHKASLGAEWQASQALSLSATLVYIGDFIDTDRYGTDPATRRAGPYGGQPCRLLRSGRRADSVCAHRQPVQRKLSGPNRLYASGAWRFRRNEGQPERFGLTNGAELS